MSDNKIGTNNTGIRVQIEQSRTRQTANTSFGHVMGQGLSQGADAVLQAGQLAAPFVPGGAVLSAAISGVGNLKSSVGAQTAAVSGAATSVGGNANTLTFSGASGVAGNTGTAGIAGTNTGDTMTRMERLQEMNQSFNMQYLTLQQRMQDESRRFTMISNIMKTKHDTAKNSISNLR